MVHRLRCFIFGTDDSVPPPSLLSFLLSRRLPSPPSRDCDAFSVFSLYMADILVLVLFNMQVAKHGTRQSSERASPSLWGKPGRGLCGKRRCPYPKGLRASQEASLRWRAKLSIAVTISSQRMLPLFGTYVASRTTAGTVCSALWQQRRIKHRALSRLQPSPPPTRTVRHMHQ